MKFLVVSDTHGRTRKVSDILSKMKDVDAVIHLGDYFDDAREIEELEDVDVIKVKGNMDGCYNDEDSFAYKVLETEYGNILLTHGHLYDVKFKLDRLRYAALEKECRAVFFGHTHVSLYEDLGDMIVLNPGSLSQPKDGNPGSYAIVNTSEDRLECSIMFYREGDTPKKKPQGGRLRGMLNYSDRF